MRETSHVDAYQGGHVGLCILSMMIEGCGGCCFPSWIALLLISTQLLFCWSFRTFYIHILYFSIPNEFCIYDLNVLSDEELAFCECFASSSFSTTLSLISMLPLFFLFLFFFSSFIVSTFLVFLSFLSYAKI